MGLGQGGGEGLEKLAKPTRRADCGQGWLGIGPALIEMGAPPAYALLATHHPDTPFAEPEPEAQKGK